MNTLGNNTVCGTNMHPLQLNKVQDSFFQRVLKEIKWFSRSNIIVYSGNIGCKNSSVTKTTSQKKKYIFYSDYFLVHLRWSDFLKRTWVHPQSCTANITRLHIPRTAFSFKECISSNAKLTRSPPVKSVLIHWPNPELHKPLCLASLATLAACVPCHVSTPFK